MEATRVQEKELKVFISFDKNIAHWVKINLMGAILGKVGNILLNFLEALADSSHVELYVPGLRLIINDAKMWAQLGVEIRIFLCFLKGDSTVL